MISTQTIQKLQQLYNAESSYRPSSTIAEQLADKTIVMLVGATCEGKNTVMEAAAAQDSRFKITGTFTSREPRDSDDTSRYTYYPNTDEGLRGILEAINNHTVVQYAVNPYANLMYGSTVDDYTGEYNLADVFSSAIESFRHLGFKRSLAITIITEPSVWLKRFEDRFPIGHPYRTARRDEAIESFTWSLTQDSTAHFWAENIDGDPARAAQTVIDISLSKSTGQPEARKLAELSLETARKITV